MENNIWRIGYSEEIKGEDTCIVRFIRSLCEVTYWFMQM
jgi:hypothetical protein